MIVVSEGQLPTAPSGPEIEPEIEPELIFDFSDGQIWWIGHPVSCPVCNFGAVLQGSDTLASCGLCVYSFRPKNGGVGGRGRGILNCPTCKMPVHFDKELPAEAETD